MLTKIKNIKLSSWILIIGAFYFTGTIIQNILAVKMFGTSTLNICDGGVIISWLVFACMDIITELFGKKKAIKYFTIASVLNLFFTLIFLLVIALPGNDAYMSDVVATMLGTNWRIVISSIAAFWIGNYVNAFIMYVMKVRSKDEHNKVGFVIRAIISTIAGQFIDNTLFYLLAFSPLGIAGTYELAWVSLFQNVAITTAIETIVEALFSPLTALFVAYLKRLRDKEISKNEENLL